MDAVKASWLFLWVNILIPALQARTKAQQDRRPSPSRTPSSGVLLQAKRLLSHRLSPPVATQTTALPWRRRFCSSTVWRLPLQPLGTRPRLPHSWLPERPPWLPHPHGSPAPVHGSPNSLASPQGIQHWHGPHGFPYSPMASHTMSTFSSTSANIRLSGSAVKYGGSLNKKKTETAPKPKRGISEDPYSLKEFELLL